MDTPSRRDFLKKASIVGAAAVAYPIIGNPVHAESKVIIETHNDLHSIVLPICKTNKTTS
jgi:hypothetical protein